MRISNAKKLIVSGALCLGLFLVVAGCGGGGSSSSTESSGTTESQSTGETTGGGSSEGAAASAAQVIKPYVGQPSPFPVTEALKEVPKGATIAYVDCGTGICGLFWELLQPAAKAMGVKLTHIKAGSAANTVSAAFDTVVAQKPDAVIVTAINLELWSKQLKELQEAGIPVVTTGITGAEEYGIESPQASDNFSKRQGELMANYVVAKMGEEENIAIYEVPELPFSGITVEAFNEEIASVCPKCSVRTVQIPVAATGNTAPSMIVSDLQANPETTLAVFSSDETELGLPQALKAAGIEIETLGGSPGPPNFQYVKEGSETAVLAADLPVVTWTLVDQAAREIIGQKLTGPEAEGQLVNQFLTQPDITFNPKMGWTGYPEFAERFEKLWGVGG